MKKILLLILCFVLYHGTFGQYVNTQQISAPYSLFNPKGGLKADSSLILSSFSDTTRANRGQYIKFYPYTVIAISDSLWMRNSTATKWLNITGGGGGGGSGTLTNWLFTNANGFVGSVLNPTTVPNLTLTTNLTQNTVPYINSAGGLVSVGLNATANNKYLRQLSSGIPSFEEISASDLPDSSGNYIWNTTIQQPTSNFNISGAGVLGTTLTIGSAATGAVTDSFLLRVGATGLVRQRTFSAVVQSIIDTINNPSGGGAGNFWKTVGNANTTAGTHFLGTTDNIDLVLKRSSAEGLRLVSTGVTLPASRVITWTGENTITSGFTAGGLGKVIHQAVPANTGTAFWVIPKGTPTVETYQMGVIQSEIGLLGNDFVADPANFSKIIITNAAGGFGILSYREGTGVHKPLIFGQATLLAKSEFLRIDTNSNIVIPPAPPIVDTAYDLLARNRNTGVIGYAPRDPLSGLTSGSAWQLIGNTLASPGTMFLGTLSNNSLRLRTNNTQYAILDSLGRFGIGTNTPSYVLDVTGRARITDTTRLMLVPPGAATDSIMTIDIATGRVRARSITVGSGSVINVSSGNFSPLFTVGITNPTTTPAFTFTASNAAAGTVFGNNTGSAAAAAFTAVPVLGLAGTTAGTLGFSGITSGLVIIKTANAAGTWNFTLPTVDGDPTQFLTTDGTGITNWATLSGSNITGAALTKVDDTNVTLTLSGSPTTALLNASSITVGWAGTLAVARGGTNISSYAVGDILYASATGVLSKLAIGTTGMKLTVVGGVPVWRDSAAVGGSQSWQSVMTIGNTSNLAALINKDNIGTTATDGVLIDNATVATVGAQQYSPNLTLSGNGWKTNATAASQAVDYRLLLVPVQGAANPTSILKFQSSINGGAYADKFGMGSDGDFYISGSAGTSGQVFTSGGVNVVASWTTPTVYQATGNYITALTGDGTATGPGSVPLTLTTVNSNVGSFTNGSFTVNAKGLITAASSGSAPEVPLTFSTGLTRTVNTITSNISTGIAGSQTIYGGTAANEDLTIQGTVHATKTTSYVILQPTTGNVGINKTAPAYALDVTGVINATSAGFFGSNVESGANGGNTGVLKLYSATSGYVNISNSGGAITSWTLTLPSIDGDANQFLRTDGAGITSWVAGSSVFSGLTPATGTNTIDNTNYLQEWQWNTLAGATGLKLSSTSTAAASNAQKLFEIALSGTNGTSAQTTYSAYISNTHAGTTSTNVGLYVNASGGTTANHALVVPSTGGNVGIGNTNPLAKLHVTGGLLVEGVTGTNPLNGAGTRLVWIPNKSTLVAGTATGANLDTDSLGSYSIVTGYDNKSGAYYGGGFQAVFGRSNTALNNYSIVAGQDNYTSALHNVALGNGNIVMANAGAAIGSNDTISLGGNAGMALGQGNRVYAHSGIALGYYLSSTRTDQVVVGSWNDTTAQGTNAQFVVGVGTSNTVRYNALSTREDGETVLGQNGYIQGSLSMVGSTSGIFTQKTPAVAGTWTHIWPAAAAAVNGYVLAGNTDGTSSWVVQGGGSGANTALSNLASVAINAALVLGTTDAFALGSTTKQWSDLFLAEGGVINWDNGDAIITQTGNDVLLTGATFTSNQNALGSTPADGILISNTTAAAVGAQQFSPALHFVGKGWKTTATAASQDVSFRAYVTPVQGAANPTGYLGFGSSINGAAYTNDQLILSSAGNVGIGTTAPITPLHVKASSGTTGTVIEGGTSSGNYAQMAFGETGFAEGSYAEFIRFSNASTQAGTYYISNESHPIVLSTTNNSPYANDFVLAANGNVTILTLAGTGSRAVVADVNGVLSAPVSDIRLKKLIEPINNTIDVLGLLRDSTRRGIFYNWKDPKRGTERELGFAAQSFQDIPGMTGTMNASGDMYFNYDKMTALLFEQNRLLLQKIEALEKQVKEIQK